ncbi:YIP1 family protein [Gemmatimonas phototrophica]|uniref:Yip1 domain-containing protein n=1 Tax=Gemmatimonas phototrophica TaxID=1379270 RepID=A0A143BKT8_9BACT|nr:YIP1 family protein [Gemmatimonas phototrophica]AMW05151.1 hypothetical protein GEMMAAP_10630 [Gemmatimonas phototrophica]
MSEITTSSDKSGGVLEDSLEVLWAPATVFQRSATRGVGMYMLVLTAFLIIVMLATKGLLQPYMDANYDLQMIKMAEQGKPVPTEGLETIRSISSWTLLIGWSLTAVFSGIAGGIITWLAAKLVRTPLAFGRAVFIATLASVPRVIGFLSMAVQGALVNPDTITSPFSASLGPARFLDARTANSAVLAILGGIDLFTAWNIVITAIGVSVIAKTSRSSGWIVSVIAWALSVILTLLPVLLT